VELISADVRLPERRTPIRPSDVVAFWQVVRSMPSRPRMVGALFYAGDHTTAEIASILECPEGTVRSDLSRARVVLAEQLRC